MSSVDAVRQGSRRRQTEPGHALDELEVRALRIEPKQPDRDHEADERHHVGGPVASSFFWLTKSSSGARER
jgi:hypothetical protein